MGYMQEYHWERDVGIFLDIRNSRPFTTSIIFAIPHIVNVDYFHILFLALDVLHAEMQQRP
jgi:hypothetical protein